MIVSSNPSLPFRYRRLEKAFRLAVDIAARDLFMVCMFCSTQCSENQYLYLSKQLIYLYMYVGYSLCGSGL